jgi:hypothetical protein
MVSDKLDDMVSDKLDDMVSDKLDDKLDDIIIVLLFTKIYLMNIY